MSLIIETGRGHFDGDDQIAELMGRHGLTQGGDGLVEALRGMFDGRGRDQDAAVEIGEHPLGARLGTVDGDDAKVLRLSLLDPGMQGAGRLGHRGEPRRAAPAAECSSHTNTSGLAREKSQTRRLVRMAGREEFSLR